MLCPPSACVIFARRSVFAEIINHYLDCQYLDWTVVR